MSTLLGLLLLKCLVERQGRTGTSVCTQAVTESAERSLVCFGFCSEQNCERTAVALIVTGAAPALLLHNSSSSYLQELVITAAAVHVPSVFTDQLMKFTLTAGVELPGTILGLCFPCPVSGSNISSECCCFRSWNFSLLHLAGLLIIPEAQLEGDVALMQKPLFNWLHLKIDLFFIFEGHKISLPFKDVWP